MIRNLSSIRLRMSATGLSSRNYSSRISTAMSMRAKYKSSSTKLDGLNSVKTDRYSNKTESYLKDLSSSATMSDYRVQAAQSMITLSKTCGNFDTAMKKNLAEEGVPEDISFKFDYDISSGEAKITDISDEAYLSSVQSALKKTMKTVDLDTVAKGSKILNGKMAEAYYPEVAEALEKCFGQDISDLSVDRSGNILGMNRKLRAAITSEMTDRSFDGHCFPRQY